MTSEEFAALFLAWRHSASEDGDGGLAAWCRERLLATLNFGDTENTGDAHRGRLESMVLR